MMEQVALSGVEPGQRCRVEEIGCPAVGPAPDGFGADGRDGGGLPAPGPWGDPVAFEVRGTVIALRAADAGQIFGRVER